MALYDDAVAIWDFENNANDTKSGHNLTANGTPTYSTTTPPQGSYWAVLNGSSQYFSLADDAHFTISGNYSVSFWVQFDALATYHTPIGQWDGSAYSADGNGWIVTLRDDVDGGNWRWTCKHALEGTATVSFLASITPATGTRYHVVMAFDDTANTCAWYISTTSFGNISNGTTSAMTTSVTNSTVALKIGLDDGSGYLDGNIDEVAFFTKAVSAAEAESIFKGTGAGGWREAGGGAATVTQEGYRWRLDDGDQANATWAASQDTGITAPANSIRRLRVILDTSGDANAATYQLEYKEANDAGWTKVA